MKKVPDVIYFYSQVCSLDERIIIFLAFFFGKKHPFIPTVCKLLSTNPQTSPVILPEHRQVKRKQI
jgi:hypothetical protein